MEKPLFKIICSVASACLMMASCSNSSNQGGLDYTASKIIATSPELSLEKQLIQEANLMRKQQGVSPVEYHAGISSSARQHSHFMSKNAGKFSVISKNLTHTGLRGRIQSANDNYDVKSLGENVAYMTMRPTVAKDTIKAWYDSKSHRRILLGKNFEFCGLGVKVVGDKMFATMLMAEPRMHQRPNFLGVQSF